MTSEFYSKKNIAVQTFGCRLNTHESEVIRRKAAQAGLQTLEGGSVIFNTCAVTGEAVRQAKQAIRKARRENPDARIIVTGCAAQTGADEFALMPEVDLVLGNEEKFHEASYRALPDFGSNNPDKCRVSDIMAPRPFNLEPIQKISHRTRAFVQVQNGCDHRCTFCIIPFGRGNSRSAPIGDVVNQVRGLAENGYREIVLTGVDTTSYGPDLEGTPRLGTLVKQILRDVPEVARLRLSSIDSVEVDDELLEVIENEPRFMPHLHLSLQHGNDLILKRMKRRHNRQQSIQFCNRIRSIRPEITFGADLITGFPTETEEMFEDTLSVVEACGLTYLHVFPYSPRPGTPAARMPQLERSTILERASRLRQRGVLARQKYFDQLNGTIQTVLVERGGTGYTPGYAPVRIERAVTGTIIDVKIAGHDGANLIGERQEELLAG